MNYVEEIKQQGRQEGRLETIEGLLRAGIGWPVIRSATGIDEHTYRTLKRDSANGAEQAAPAKAPAIRTSTRGAPRTSAADAVPW